MQKEVSTEKKIEPNSNAGVWVKASERLPDKEGQYFVNMPTAAAKTSFYFNGKKFETHSYVRIEEIEWLDEQPIPVQRWCIDKKAIEAGVMCGYMNNDGSCNSCESAQQPIPVNQNDYWKDIEELGMGIDNAMAIINECELKVVKGHPDPGALNDCINNVKDAHRHWQQLKSSPSPTTNFNDNEKQSDLFKENNY